MQKKSGQTPFTLYSQLYSAFRKSIPFFISNFRIDKMNVFRYNFVSMWGDM